MKWKCLNFCFISWQDEISDDSSSHSGSGRENKFCRVILPDGSTTVVYAKQGQTIKQVLHKQCERRNMTMAAMDVFHVGSDKVWENFN